MPHTEIISNVDGAIATVILNRPDALNAITPTMLAELNAEFAALGENDGVRVVVLTGAGKAFSAGVDLKALGGRPIENGGVGDILDDPANALLDCIAQMPQIVIAKVNGFCFTGALELALGCDLMVVAEEAKLGDTHTKFGLRPSWGMSQRLPRAVGIARARELSFTARTFTGTEALAYGMAILAPPRAELDAAVSSLAEQLSGNSPGALAAGKHLYNEGGAKSLEDGLQFERTTFFPIADTMDRLGQFLKK